MTQVSFQDRLKFNAFCSHVTNPSRHVTTTNRLYYTVSTQPKTTLRAAVDFAPRYHRVTLSSAKMDLSNDKFLHKRAESAKREAVARARLEDKVMSRSREQRDTDTRGGWKYRRAHSKIFHTTFRPMRPGDDSNKLARDWYANHTHPYKNPRPFDHRGLDDSETAWTRLNTVKTPDPFHIKLKNKSLTDSFREPYIGPSMSHATRDINFKLRTQKTPELRYDSKLIRNKGRYSPAFTAREAYFNRVYKNIST